MIINIFNGALNKDIRTKDILKIKILTTFLLLLICTKTKNHNYIIYLNQLNLNAVSLKKKFAFAR